MASANRDSLDFNGKVVLITGAATGIGRAVAVGFASRGAKVAIGDINEAAATETLDLIKRAGVGVCCGQTRRDRSDEDRGHREAHLGIRVNALAPGWVRTRLTKGLEEDQELNEQMKAAVPMHRSAEPEEMAGIVIFLCSDAASYVQRPDLCRGRRSSDPRTRAGGVRGRRRQGVRSHEAHRGIRVPQVRQSIPTPGWMRAPGEAEGSVALESAIDELSYALGIDPIELRVKNHAHVHPESSLPWSSNALLDCYRQGAERFGWAARNPEPRSMQSGGQLVGYGMARAALFAYQPTCKAIASIRRDGTAFVRSGATDRGRHLHRDDDARR